MSFTRRESLKSRLLSTSAAALLAFPAAMAGSGGAFAQDQDQDQGLEEEIEEVVVTGSRIRRAGFDTLQPAVQVDADFVDERGFTNVAEALNQVPAFSIPGASNNGGQSSGTVGQNFVNTFGLGSQRTLTLINGRRTVGQNTPTVIGVATGALGTGQGLQVDLNIIPTALIERVETVFVGGAPIYGSDAIAGTVNVILKDDFEGWNSDAQFGISQRGDAENFRIRTLVGGNFADGKGNATISAEFVTIKPLEGTDRQRALDQYGFCANPADTGPSDGIIDNLFCRDALSVWAVPNSPLPTLEAGLAINTGTTQPIDGDEVTIANMFTDPETGLPVMFDLAGNLTDVNSLGIGNPRQLFFTQGAGCGVNKVFLCLAETNTLISPLDRWIVTGNAHYQVTDNVRFFIETLAARSRSTDRNNQPFWSISVFGPGAQGQLKININDNPYLLESQKEFFRTQLLAKADEYNTNMRDQLPSGYNPNGTPVDPDEDPILDMNGDPLQELDPSDDVDPEVFSNELFMNRSNRDLIENRENSRDQSVYRIASGFEGDFQFMGNNWNWNAYYIWGVTDALTRQNQPNGDRFNLALDAVVDPDTGDIVCRSQIDPDLASRPSDNTQASPFPSPDITECIPFNPFGANRNQDMEAIRNYITQQQFRSTNIRQQVIEANIDGDLLQLPAGPMGFAMGVTHRREDGQFNVDQGSELGIDVTSPVQNVRGGFNTYEIYAETLIPLITNGEGLPISLPFISTLQAEGALRFVDNTNAGKDVTWTAGGRLGLNLPLLGDSGFTLRGNYTRSIRSPSIPELFLPTSQIFTFAQDPCDPRFITGGTNPSVRQANCQAEFNQVQPNIDLNTWQSVIVNASQPATTGGNQNLVNEVADSWTIGGIFQPEFLPGFSATIDWTRINLTNGIASLTATQLLNACYDSPSYPNVPACGAFSRDPVSFDILNPALGFVNAAQIYFDGLVVNFTYRNSFADLPIPAVNELPGSFEITGNFFHTRNNVTIVAAGVPTQNDNTQGFEPLRYQLNFRYELDRFSMLWQTLFTSGANFNNANSRELNEFFGFPGVRYHNVTFRYQITDNLSGRIIINNIFDKIDGPLLSASIGGNANFFNDIVGRRFVFGISAEF